MIKFSIQTQAFYDTLLEYSELPDDLIDITHEQHQALFEAINIGCIVFPDLSISTPQPSQFHLWNGDDWIDPRTPEEIVAYERSLMPNLTPIEFEIKLYKAGLYDTVKNYIENEASVPVKIAYNRAAFFSRTDPFVTTAMRDLNLTDEQVDVVWIGS